MTKMNLKTLTILLAVILFQFLYLHFSSEFVQFGSLLNSFISIIFVGVEISIASFFLKRINPRLFPLADEKLLESRKKSFLGFHGFRQLVIIFSLSLPFGYLNSTFNKYFTYNKMEFVERTVPMEVQAQNAAVDLPTAYAKYYAVVVISAAKEELFYRFFVLRVLLGIVSFPLAVLFSSLVFGFAHMPGRWQPELAYGSYKVLPCSLSGIIYGLGYGKSSFFAAVLLHVLSNELVGNKSAWVKAFAGFFILALVFILLEACIKKLVSLSRKKIL